jgi:hypothetical protein
MSGSTCCDVCCDCSQVDRASDLTLSRIQSGIWGHDTAAAFLTAAALACVLSAALMMLTCVAAAVSPRPYLPQLRATYIPKSKTRNYFPCTQNAVSRV